MQQYFPGKSYAGYQDGDGFKGLEQEVLEEPAAAYATRMKHLLETHQEEDVAIRGAAFKRTIPRIYQYTCAVTGWSLTTPAQVQMIDACHIVPFSQSLDDTITNGIALCPTIHRAFDRGLISLDTQYRIILSKDLTENTTTVSLAQFAGRTILLPRDPAYHPGQENLRWHRARWGF
ncbi:MAG: HNH endonuclease [Bacteroidia bacterium]|nr:HNH endonuclease [Bacteroidia bacterium]